MKEREYGDVLNMFISKELLFLKQIFPYLGFKNVERHDGVLLSSVLAALTRMHNLAVQIN